MLSGYRFEASSMVGETIPGDHDGMVIVGDIGFASLCEHHMLPFFGTVDLAYLPNAQGHVVGLSKVARLVEVLSQRLQVQERMTMEIVRAMIDGFSPRGVLVVVRAEHLCVTARGVKSRGSIVTTTFASGELRESGAQAYEARALILGQGR
jgi:GTP cyclohydrolase I